MASSKRYGNSAKKTTEARTKTQPLNGLTSTSVSMPKPKVKIVKCEKCGGYRYGFGGPHAALRDRGISYDCVGEII